MHIYIKNMVCNRCIKVVKEELEKTGLTENNIKLGEVEIISGEKIDTDSLTKILSQIGFELLEDKNIRLIESIIPKIREGFKWRQALSTTLSMLVMEISEIPRTIL